jgi:hypothetical protein
MPKDLSGNKPNPDPTQNNTLPAVSYIKPDDIVDGHPGTSTPAMFEAFVKNIVQTVKANPDVWDSTAILITTDESGGTADLLSILSIRFDTIWSYERPDCQFKSSTEVSRSWNEGGLGKAPSRRTGRRGKEVYLFTGK